MNIGNEQATISASHGYHPSRNAPRLSREREEPSGRTCQGVDVATGLDSQEAGIPQLAINSNVEMVEK